ncbi:MAG: hypothetical protein P8N63_06945, partial [Pseudomonadales bacterium]|nr:hypothetical protein [Pseudomonadales bacterium]
AQRLVRKLCSECATAYQPDNIEASWMQRYLTPDVIANASIRTSAGCAHCNQTGYRGRIGIYEMLVIKDNIADALRRGNASEFVQLANAQPGFKPLIVSALEHAVNGVTTISEVLRVAQQFEEAEAPSLAPDEPTTYEPTRVETDGVLSATESDLRSEREASAATNELTLERLN